ncbi:MAG: hypothetical protein V1914_04405 [archaeon]
MVGLLNKGGKISWDLLAVILITLAVLVTMLLFSAFIREKVVEAFQVFVGTIFGD